MNFFRISRQIPENSEVCRFFNQICENKSEICRKFWILWKKFTIIVNYSLHSLIGTAACSSAAQRRRARTAAPTGATRSGTVRANRLLHCEGSGKLDRARSRLYRSQILQENIRWNSYLFEKKIEKALDEIYKIYMLLHRSDLNISEKVRLTF